MKSFSLIIPVYNEEEILEKQVNRLITEVDNLASYGEYEILLVEKVSSDRTYSIAQKLAG